MADPHQPSPSRTLLGNEQAPLFLSWQAGVLRLAYFGCGSAAAGPNAGKHIVAHHAQGSLAGVETVKAGYTPRRCTRPTKLRPWGNFLDRGDGPPVS